MTDGRHKKAHGAFEEYTLEELDHEVAAMQRLGFRSRVSVVLVDIGTLIDLGPMRSRVCRGNRV